MQTTACLEANTFTSTPFFRQKPVVFGTFSTEIHLPAQHGEKYDENQKFQPNTRCLCRRHLPLSQCQGGN